MYTPNSEMIINIPWVKNKKGRKIWKILKSCPSRTNKNAKNATQDAINFNYKLVQSFYICEIHHKNAQALFAFEFLEKRPALLTSYQ